MMTTCINVVCWEIYYFDWSLISCYGVLNASEFACQSFVDTVLGDILSCFLSADRETKAGIATKLVLINAYV